MAAVDYSDDPTMGPCIGCGVLGEDCDVHHTGCECDLEACVKVICDGCRMIEGNWAWIDRGDDASIEVHIDCYTRMIKEETS